MRLRRRLRRHGPNQLQEVLPASPLSVLLRQLASPIVYLLAVAAALVAFAFGEWLDGSAIFGVLALNTVIGFVTELRAGALDGCAAGAWAACRSRVLRDGRDAVLPATDLVPGDVLLLEAGDVVTADVRLVEASKMKADESTLTGESLPVSKSSEELWAKRHHWPSARRWCSRERR